MLRVLEKEPNKQTECVSAEKNIVFLTEKENFLQKML